MTFTERIAKTFFCLTSMVDGRGCGNDFHFLEIAWAPGCFSFLIYFVMMLQG